MAESLVTDRPLPVQPSGTRASGWYGLLFVIGTEAALFAYLLFSYFFLASQAPGIWPPHGVPSMRIAGPNTVILLASSLTAWWGQSGIERGNRHRLLAGLGLTRLVRCSSPCRSWNGAISRSHRAATRMARSTSRSPACT